MKKVFAFLSVFALTIALFGFSSNTTASAAEDKFIKDPNITENDIPMYIMNSIYTTYPNFYDFANGGDDQWKGASRMYPWNETRLQVKQMNANGEYTGKEYAIFFSGSTTADSAGAGNNLLFYTTDSSGNVKLGRMNNGTWGSSGVPMDPSLSHMRTNITGKDITFDAVDLWAAGGSANGSNLYNRMFVFDGNGRMIRGLAGDIGYANPTEAGKEGYYQNAFPNEYCYVDGVVQKMEADTVCDKAMIPQLDEDGNEVLDGDGNLVMVESEFDKVVTGRFVWEWVSEEVFNSESFIGVNTVGYLAEGWDAMKWDYATKEESSNGYICIAFVSSEGKSCSLTTDQLNVYNETLKAAGTPDDKLATAETTRKCARMITVPTGGWSFDFGYLDKGFTSLYDCFMDMFTSGYKYGRTTDEAGKGMAYQMTYDFSVKPLFIQDKVIDGQSYQTLEGRNVIEVLAGSKFNPAKNVVYTGMGKYWQTPGDLTSYKSDMSVLELRIVQDGSTVVQPITGYKSQEEMVKDYVKDYNEFLATKYSGMKNYKNDGTNITFDVTVEGEVKTKTIPLLPVPTSAYTQADYKDKFYNVLNIDDFVYLAPLSGQFVFEAKYYEKWSWMYEYICKYNTKGVTLDAKNGCSSPGSFKGELMAFFVEAPAGLYSPGWGSGNGDWSNGAATKWIVTKTNLDLWNEFEIDTLGAPINTKYNLTFACKNTATGNESEISLSYVVVDSYTPILEINTNNLHYAPSTETGVAVVAPIDKYQLCTAYDGCYSSLNGNIKGNDISQYVTYEAVDGDFDFDNPKEGKYLIRATITNGSKSVSKILTLIIEDMTAPIVYTEDIVVPYGSKFDYSMGITYAYDAVDGNLTLNDTRNWFVDNSLNPVDTLTPGNYRVSIGVYDKSGNCKDCSYEVVVSPSVEKGVSDQIAKLKDEIETLKGMVDAQQQQMDEVLEGIDTVTEKVTAEPAKKCGSKSAVLVEFLAATSLLVVFLKKRH